MNFLFARLDWRFVRSLGELQILTRVSYAMLVIVPILAGIWNAPPMRDWVSHNLPHSWVFAFLAALAVTLAQVIYQLRAPDIVRHSTLDQFVRDARREYTDQSALERVEAADRALDRRSRPGLSLTQFIYYYEPAEKIANIEKRIEQFLRHNADTLSLDRGLWDEGREHFLKDGIQEIAFEVWDVYGDYVSREAFSRVSNRSLYSERKDLKLLTQLQFSQANVPCSQTLALEARALSEGRPHDPREVLSVTERQLHNTTKIGYAARLQYLTEADRRPLAMLTASILYAAAIALITVITVDQTRTVLIAAGWP
jgi:hypothetical protein